MSARLLQRYIALPYRKPLGYALLLHIILLLMLIVSAYHRHPLAMPTHSAQALKAVMISATVLQPPAPKVVKKAKALKRHHHVVHHKPIKVHHKKVVVKKVVHKKTPHKPVVTATKPTKSAKPIAKRSVPTNKKPAAISAHQHSKVSTTHKTAVQPTAAGKAKPVAAVKKVSVAKPAIKKVVTAKPPKPAVALKPTIAHATVAATTKNTAPTMSRSEINRYTTQITQAIGEHWIIPVGADPSLSCRLDITLAEGGEVLNVNLVRSSGNSALDRSAVTAVLQASPLPVPSGTDFALFRHIRLTVRPESVT
ncbi:MAG: cell envelope integrity protein TolA [Gammaproteobacteria bacterium]|nr:cell envelope integrity protein TolA [Gammaproteobacteria bacterium]